MAETEIQIALSLNFVRNNLEKLFFFLQIARKIHPALADTDARRRLFLVARFSKICRL